MTITEFTTRFADEKTCRLHFKAAREQYGIVCKKCGCKEHYWLNGYWRWKCTECGFRTTLRSGTVMEHSNLGVRVWYWAIFLMTNTKKGISALELQRQIGLKNYAPTWYLAQKIRLMMGDNVIGTVLKGDVELDDAFFTAYKSAEDKDEPKPGRGSNKKSKVLVMVEADKSVKPRGKVGKLIMLTTNRVDSEAAETMDALASEVDRVYTDGYPSYNKLNQEKHVKMIVPPQEAMNVLPWVHTAISNAKRVLNGIYHSVSDKYLQLYLDEFTYKFNNRYAKCPFGNALNLVYTRVGI